jgi:3-oxoacyl-[acyl-carrier protein] reductase
MAMSFLSEDAPVSQAFDLTGRVAAITGAASGIGRSTAYVLSGAGATVVLGDIEETGLKAVADDITSRGGTAVAMHTDVTQREDVDALVARAVKDYGKLDIMANIAGVPSRGMVVDVTDQELDRILNINLKGVFYGCQAAMRVMMGQGGGNIVNVASGAIDSGAPTLAVYSMAKAAVAILTKTVAAEGAPHKIRANSLAPGIVLTGFSRPHFTTEDGEVDEAKLEGYKDWAGKTAPLGRIGLPADIAWAILYLASDASCFMTGQILRPNGGIAMPW